MLSGLRCPKRYERLRQLIVLSAIDGLHPDGGPFLGVYFNGEVGKPAVLCRAVPVLDMRGDVDDVARLQFTCGLAPFLVPAAAGGNEQRLTAFVSVPAVDAARLKRDVADGQAGVSESILSQTRPEKFFLKNSLVCSSPASNVSVWRKSVLLVMS